MIRAQVSLVVLCVLPAACGSDDVVGVPSTSADLMTTSVGTPSTAATLSDAPAMESTIDVFREVRWYLIDSITTETRSLVDGRLEEAGLSVHYNISVDLDDDPIVTLGVPTQADTDALNEALGPLNDFDVEWASYLMGGGSGSRLPTISGDETSASLNLPPPYLTEGFLDRLGQLMADLGMPPSTVTMIEQTTQADGTQMVEGEGIGVSWTKNPDDGLLITVERL